MRANFEALIDAWRGARGARERSDEHVRLTMAQALVRYLAALRAQTPDGVRPLFGGVFAIFGHGNVAGIGEALYAHRDELPTYRAHNEQAMAHAAIAYAKAHIRRRMMACTTSIGPGATNLVTAAALAHVNRLPVLFLPGDVFVSRAPDPVLQQVEDFHDGTVSANDCFRPVSRYFDRIVHPAQLLTALPQALRVLTDPALCGPVTLALPQDVQTMAYDYPDDFFAPRGRRVRRAAAARGRARATPRRCCAARSGRCSSPAAACCTGCATDALRAFAEAHGVPVAETQAGKGALPWDHPLQLGAIGVTGSPAANALARGRRRRARGRHAAVRTSPPARIRCSRRRGSSTSTSTPSTRASGAASSWSPTRSSASTRCRQRCRRWRAESAWQDRAQRAADDWRDGHRAPHRPARRRRCPTTAT